MILIVEDDSDVRVVYARYLASHGFQVETAADGTQAVHLAESIGPSLIVMDLSLPHLDGWQATRQLKSDPRTRHIPVIACTGHVSGTSVERALEAGCDAYLVKPCLPKDLLDEIRRVLGRRRGEP